MSTSTVRTARRVAMRGHHAVPAAIDADARNADRFTVHPTAESWSIEQTLVDPEGDGEWSLEITVDLRASAALGDVAATFHGLRHR